MTAERPGNQVYREWVTVYGYHLAFFEYGQHIFQVFFIIYTQFLTKLIEFVRHSILIIGQEVEPVMYFANWQHRLELIVS